MSLQHVIVVGGGLAAVTAAHELRQDGFDGSVTVLGEEPHKPYDRPPLSKSFLVDAAEPTTPVVNSSDWYGAQNVELRTGTRVEALDLGSRKVALSNGRHMSFDKLLLATGSRPRRLKVPGSDAACVHYLRTVDDAAALRSSLRASPSRVVVVGAGWIGLESASAARSLGHDVTILDPQPAPLSRVLGPLIGKIFADLHRDHGVSFRRTGVQEFQVQRGKVSGVVTTDAEVLPADVVIVGVGVEPAVELAERAGLNVHDGVSTDAGMRTSHPDVYAAGDIASAINPLLGRRLRVEHWDNARTSSSVAARSMLGHTSVHDTVPYFFSDQYDMGMEYSGFAGLGDYDRVVIRGDTGARTFIAFWMAESRVVAAMNMNEWDVSEALQELIRSKRRVDPAELADSDVPLNHLLGQSIRGAA